MNEELIYGNNVIITGGFYIGQVGQLKGKITQNIIKAPAKIDKITGKQSVPAVTEKRDIYRVMLIDGLVIELNGKNLEKLNIDIKK